MKLVLPEIEFRENVGFDTKIDIFKRKKFGERLANLIENTDDSLVFALDADWGEGKSTFVKMWRGYLEHQRENKLKTM
jgi:tRNA A37 threonylcarbamoyladenosine biosynthesis protein TsaE